MDSLKSKVAELKAALAATSGMLSGAPVEVREAVVELKGEMQREGRTARELAKTLGVHESTLCRWGREVESSKDQKRRGPRASSEGMSGFRMVRLAPADTKSAERETGPMPTVSSLRVAHAPSGLVIDGLDVESLAALLRRMS